MAMCSLDTLGSALAKCSLASSLSCSYPFPMPGGQTWMYAPRKAARVSYCLWMGRWSLAHNRDAIGATRRVAISRPTRQRSLAALVAPMTWVNWLLGTDRSFVGASAGLTCVTPPDRPMTAFIRRTSTFQGGGSLACSKYVRRQHRCTGITGTFTGTLPVRLASHLSAPTSTGPSTRTPAAGRLTKINAKASRFPT